MTEKGATRLRQLAEYLRTTVTKIWEENPYRFNMLHWADGYFENKENPICNTSACALGWATNIFQELRIIYKPHFDFTSDFDFTFDIINEETGSFATNGNQAAKDFFELTSDEAPKIFTSRDNNRTPANVVEHINEVLIDNGFATEGTWRDRAALL